MAERRFENSRVTESYVSMKKEVLSWQKLNVSDKTRTIHYYLPRSLNNLATYCKFVDRQERIRDQLVRGTHNRRAVEEIKIMYPIPTYGITAIKYYGYIAPYQLNAKHLWIGFMQYTTSHGLPSIYMARGIS
ncbi:hypothetical protein A3Q56_06510 [Intoshia linei]|uniref:Uncharacterized protein n=1 Tax=Intoshia linei TaxID=1819745 RepID=A0A177AWJ2_9BILA|nr:hypothetical protein A3Q56_06510 [Intoshia linei]